VTAIRFLLDEHFARRVASALQVRGIETVTVHEAGRRGELDDAHLDWASVEAWIIVTHDKRFAALARTTTEHAGLVFCAHRKYGTGGLIRELESLAETETMESMRSRVHYL
jgi:cation transport regulator ChaC